MSAKPKLRNMSDSGDGITIDRSHRDIIECALQNDFGGVDTALKRDRRLINARRTGSGITPLMAASGRGLGRMVQHLLNKDGLDLGIVDAFGKSAFDHGRLYPTIVTALVRHEHPEMDWKEPGIFPL